jgi:hypothetical protein
LVDEDLRPSSSIGVQQRQQSDAVSITKDPTSVEASDKDAAGDTSIATFRPDSGQSTDDGCEQAMPQVSVSTNQHAEGRPKKTGVKKQKKGGKKRWLPSPDSIFRCCHSDCDSKVGRRMSATGICKHWNVAHSGHQLEDGATFQEVSSGRKFRLVDIFPYVVKCQICGSIRRVKFSILDLLNWRTLLSWSLIVLKPIRIRFLYCSGSEFPYLSGSGSYPKFYKCWKI